jgi:HTH-type transcriptional regulator/antitoxin HigA
MTMIHTTPNIPQPQAILRAWMPFKEIIGATKIRNDSDYARIAATVETLLDEVGDNETHPLADVLDYLAGLMQTYEAERCPIPPAEPREVLRFLMDQHQIEPEDLSDCAPTQRIADLLDGKQAINLDTAKKLARRFNIGADLFL